MKKMRQLNEVIIHCSVSTWGDVNVIRKWHLERKFSDCGYHFVIMNGFRKHKSKYYHYLDGLIEIGRPLRRQGAHTRGHNKGTIGICLIGNGSYTPKQFDSLERLIILLIRDFEIKKISGHSDYAKGRKCPQFDVKKFRDKLICKAVKKHD